MNQNESDDTTERSGVKFPIRPVQKASDILPSTSPAHSSPPSAATANAATAGATDSDAPRTNDNLRASSRTPISPSARIVGQKTGTSNLKSKFKGLSINMAAKYEAKNVGLGEVATGELKIHHGPVEEHEARVRAQSTSCWLMRFTTTLASAVMVFVVYLITLETLLSCTLCVGLTIYWYREVR